MEFIMPILVNKISIPDLGLEIDMDINATVIHKGSSFENYNARAFYLNVIKQNLKDYYSDELNTRKVINACITLFHMADWYIPMIETKDEHFKKIFLSMESWKVSQMELNTVIKRKSFKQVKKSVLTYIPD